MRVRAIRHTEPVVQISAAIITASVALLVGIVAAVVTPAVTALRARRQAINDRFDAALAALLLAQASRWTPSGMAEAPGGRTPEEHREFNLRMNEKGIEFHVETMAAAKTALVAIEKYVPETRDWLTKGWELREDDEPKFRAAIEKRRPAALKAERLFKQRRPLSS